MAGRCNEVEQHVDTIVPESRVTLDAGLFSENVIVLPLEVSDNLGETATV